MATKAGSGDNMGAILAALATMQSNVATKEKTAAHEYLERFQKSVRSPFGLEDTTVTDTRISMKRGAALILCYKMNQRL